MIKLLYNCSFHHFPIGVPSIDMINVKGTLV